MRFCHSTEPFWPISLWIKIIKRVRYKLSTWLSAEIKAKVNAGDTLLRKSCKNKNTYFCEEYKQNGFAAKILKENWEVIARYFHENINFCYESLVFPSDLKVAEMKLEISIRN